MTIFRLFAICLLPMCLSMTITAQTEPISPENPIITAENADQVQELAMLGRGYPFNIAYSPDGNLIAVASSVGVWLYDVHNSSAEPHFLFDNTLHGFIRSIAFSPDSQFIVAGTFAPYMDSFEYALRIWNIETGELVHRLLGHKGQVDIVTYSPNGQFVASGSADGTIRLWDAQSGEHIKTLPQPHDDSMIYASIASLAYSPDGQMLVVAYYFHSYGEHVPHSVQVWDIGKAEIVYHVIQSSAHVAYSPDGQFIASGGDDLIVWDSQTGIALYVLDLFIGDMTFSADGESIIAKVGQNIVFIDTQTGDIQHTLHYPEQYVGLSKIADMPTGQLLVTYLSLSNQDNGILKLWDTQSQIPQPLDEFNITFQQTRPFAFSPDSVYIAYTQNFSLRILPINTLIAQPPIEIDDTFLTFNAHSIDIAFSPDGHFIAIQLNDVIQIWDVEARILVNQLEDINGYSENMFYSPDGRFIVMKLRNIIQMWNIETGEITRIAEDEMSNFVDRPDSELIVTNTEYEVFLSDAQTGELLHTLDGHTDSAYAMFSPDGRIIVSSSSDGTIRIWGIPVGDD